MGFQWTLALLPAFPIALLVLRLWHLSKQDLNTMLVLVQNVGPLDLVSSLVISLVWVPPLVLLAGHACGLLYQVSAPERAAERPSWLTRTTDRTPDWAITFTVMWAAATWQLRFLPSLSMLALMILGLTVRKRYPNRPRLALAMCVILPALVAVAIYLWFAPAIGDAFANDELVLALLILLPPALTLLLTGPIPAQVAWPATHLPAAAAALVGPFVLAVIFLRTPVLPAVALELEAREPGASPEVVLGYVVTIDDAMTTLIDDVGVVRFIPNEDIEVKVLCGGEERVPYSVVDTYGWHVERSMMEWFLPAREPRTTDEVRCAGRPDTRSEGSRTTR